MFTKNLKKGNFFKQKVLIKIEVCSSKCHGGRNGNQCESQKKTGKKIF